MPARTFTLLLDAAAARAAFDQLQLFGALSLADSLVWGDTQAQGRVRHSIAELHRLAYGEDG